MKPSQRRSLHHNYSSIFTSFTKFLLVIGAILVLGMRAMPDSVNTTVTHFYQSNKQNFSNPERGFYWVFDPIGEDGKNSVYPLDLFQLQALKQKNISTIRRIYLLDEFRDKPISQSYLEMIADDFEKARQAGIKIIVRFTYNWLDGGPDAPTNIILDHLDSLKPILQENYDVLAYMEAGFIGYFGEWHDSTNNLVDLKTLDVTEDARRIVLQILSVLPTERMVAIRYYKQKQQILNNDRPLTAQEAFNGSQRSRVGHHNDGFRAAIDDGGTYVSTDPTIVNRVKSWLNLDTRYVVQGGEPSWASNPPEYDDCPGALDDFVRMHWSGMNVNQYDPGAHPVYQGWKEQGCMEEIKISLGYRFRLVSSQIPVTVEPNGIFAMQLEIINDGWASPYNPRELEVILRNGDNEYYLSVSEDPRTWLPGDPIKLDIQGGIPKNMPTGIYQVFLSLPDPTPQLYNRPEYSIRFANQDTWEESSGYNSLLTNVFINSTLAKTSYSGANFFQLKQSSSNN